MAGDGKNLKASGLGRSPGSNGDTTWTLRHGCCYTNDLSVRRALKAAGIEFMDGNGGGPGVRLRKRQGKKAQ
jgi:hypothetical protein